MKRLHNTASQNNIFYLNILQYVSTDRYFPETMNEVTSNWIQLGDGFYDKVSFKIVLLLQYYFKLKLFPEAMFEL